MDIRRVGVIGGGQMGSGIAEVCARAGYAVVIWDVDAGAIERAQAAVVRSLARAVERAKATEDEQAAALSRIEYTTELTEAAQADLIVEAMVEDEAIKLAVLAEVDEAAPAGALMASNTSSIPIGRLAAATSRPGQFIGLHFFNPPPVMALVEVIPGSDTSEETVSRAEEFVASLGKQGVRAPDRAGFIVNAILLPMLVDAARMVDEGLAPARDVDRALVLGAGLPMGPLALADLVGVDTVVSVSDVLYEELGDQKYLVPPLLRQMVDDGNLGKKTGKGFYEYSG